MPHRLAVRGVQEGGGQFSAIHLETVIGLWAGLTERRSARGWEVLDLLESGLSHAEAASRLGVSASAVSQRVAASSIHDELRVRDLVRFMLMFVGLEP
jgi:DNA-binding NarL/FixJ family response regulator